MEWYFNLIAGIFIGLFIGNRQFRIVAVRFFESLMSAKKHVKGGNYEAVNDEGRYQYKVIGDKLYRRLRR